MYVSYTERGLHLSNKRIISNEADDMVLVISSAGSLLPTCSLFLPSC